MLENTLEKTRMEDGCAKLRFGIKRLNARAALFLYAERVGIDASLEYQGFEKEKAEMICCDRLCFLMI